LTFDDPKVATELLSSLHLQPTISFACLYDTDGKLFASYGDDPGVAPKDIPHTAQGHAFIDGHLDITKDIFQNGERIGSIHLRANMDDLKEKMKHNGRIFAIVMIIALSGSVLLSRRLQQSISGPILTLTAAAQQVSSSGDYSLRVKRQANDELGTLYDEFNSMLERTRRSEEELRNAHDQLESRVQQRTRQLSRTNVEFSHEIAERKRAEKQLESMHEQLMETARQAGMTEIATGVLHNVGNVLNSANVSCSILNDRLRTSKIADLTRAAELIDANEHQLAQFLGEDEKGKLLPQFLVMLAEHLNQERDAMVEELHGLIEHIDHVKTIVSMQQSFAGVAGVVEAISLDSLIENALKLNSSSFEKYGIEAVREYEPMPQVSLEKQRILQVLVNLITNAKDALNSSENPHPQLTIRTSLTDEQNLRIEVADNGIGIAEKDLTGIFSHGFTTKEHGHGFGLHMSANAAKEMGGRLTADSEGPGMGATFIIELPFISAETTAVG
jgi:two-component system NtrC family sensor kinase